MPARSHRRPVVIQQLVVWSSVVVLLLAAGPVSPVGAVTPSTPEDVRAAGSCRVRAERWERLRVGL